MRPLTAVLLSAIVFLFAGCFEQGDCQNQTSNKLKVDFFDATTRKAVQLAIDSVTIDGVDGKLYEGENLNSIIIPLDPLSTSAEIMIWRTTAADATVILSYTARTTVLDPGCGAAELFTLSAIEGEPFTEAVLVQKILSNPIATNVRLYF